MFIIGAGLAGASIAQVLKSDAAVTVIDQSDPAGGASGAAAGLVNPFLGRKAPAFRQRHEAIEMLRTLLDQAGVAVLFEQTGMFNPAMDQELAETLQQRAGEYPGELEWIGREAAAERWPDVQAPLGGLWISSVGTLDIRGMIRAFLCDVTLLRKQVISFGADRHSAWVTTSDRERLEADYLVLAPGADFVRLPHLNEWPLGRVKGQTISIVSPGNLAVPCIGGKVQIIPGDDAWLIGSTFEHTFEHEDPTDEASRELMERAVSLVPQLRDSEIVWARAGIRATVPAKYSLKRLPVVGPIDTQRRIWAMIGLGSKGLLSAPLLASYLKAGLDDPFSIPGDVRIERIIHK